MKGLITPEYFDLKGAVAYTGGAISIRAWRAILKRPDAPPHSRPGGKIILARSDIDNFIRKFTKNPDSLEDLVNEVVGSLGKRSGKVKGRAGNEN